MDDLIEFVLEILVGGAMDAAGCRKVPLPVRIVLGTVLVLFFGGICALIILAGADRGSVGLVLLGVLLLAFFLFWGGHAVRNFRENRKGH
mgnify:FL=1